VDQSARNVAKVAVVWFRRDLRLTDHEPLTQALASFEKIVPLFVLSEDEDDRGMWAAGGCSRWWLHHSLRELGERLAALGAPLVLRRGRAASEVMEVVRAVGARAVFFTRLTEPAERREETSLTAALAAAGVQSIGFGGELLFDPEKTLKGDGTPFRVFTPLWKHMQTLPEPAKALGAPSAIPGLDQAATSLSVSLEALDLDPKHPWTRSLAAAWQPGEISARKELAQWASGPVRQYARDRDFPAIDGVSRISPRLHFGEVSVRSAWHNCAGVEAWRRQLAWREFGRTALLHFPECPTRPMNQQFTAFPWRADAHLDLDAWKRGQTGIPLIDAAMRQLWQTGWMHNRVRMVVGSWLVKNLRISWVEGARWFWDTLVDADLGNNTLGWQWAAGCGFDAAPYFRVFNPILQSRKFDPDGTYIRTFVPELAALGSEDLHAPWEAAPLTLKAAGIELGKTYPRPMVDLAASRDAALAAWATIRKG
jgi:deoxyribodipyrimidine photo-lyase